MTAHRNGYAKPLRELVCLADSGTWGNDGRPGVDSPVLRSSDIQDDQLSVTEAAWRVIPDGDRERRRLETGDILVTKSSGSADHIGKCALFEQPADERRYYFSNFMLRLRAHPQLADARWLFYWLTSKRGRAVLSAMNSTTSGLRNLSVPRYLDQEIPLPFPDDPKQSLAEQKRIAAILDKADTIRRRRQEAARLADQLIPSIFYEMFGDPLANNRNWQTELVEHLCTLVRGSSPRPKGDPRYYGGPVPRLMIEDITRDGKRVRPQIDTLTELGATLSRPCQAGTVVMAVSGNVGLVSILAVDACIHDGFVAFRELETKRVREDYLVHCLDLMKAAHSRNVAGAIWQNLTTDQVKAMRVPLPPPDEQDRFVRALHEVEHTIASSNRLASEGGTLFNSLVQRAFRGEL